MAHALSVNHERAHWFQFCGSTIGSAVLSLFRSEELCVALDILRHGEATTAFNRLLADGRSLLAEDSGLASAELQRVAVNLRHIRRGRQMLMDGCGTPNDISPEQASALGEAIGFTQRTLAFHTGDPDQWNTPSPIPIRTLNIRSHAQTTATDPVLGARHVFESGALLAEWGSLLWSSWGAWTPGASFSELDFNVRAYLGDALASASGSYTACLAHAMAAWDGPPWDADPRVRAHWIASMIPTISACLDIAMNPRIGPMVTDPDCDIAGLDAGVRFTSAVRAVARCGLLEHWPTEDAYRRFRAELCADSGLTFGDADAECWQTEALSAEFWTAAETGHPLLVSGFSYFDYAVWAMRRMHRFRYEEPLQWAMPWLRFFRQGDRAADFGLMVDPAKVWASAPLYWTGNTLGFEVRLAMPVGVRIAYEVLISSRNCSARCGELVEGERRAADLPGVEASDGSV